MPFCVYICKISAYKSIKKMRQPLHNKGLLMNLKFFVLISLFLMSFDSNAQDTTVSTNRLQLHNLLQSFCALTVLRNHELAVSFTLGTKTPLSHVCECASLQTVSAMSDQDVAFVLAGEVVTAEQTNKRLLERFKNCMMISS